MRPRNREVNIFNLSMLDVISGALGAVLIIMVILMPYYKKESVDYRTEIQQMQQHLEKSRQQTQQAEQQARDAKTQAEENKKRADAAEQKLAKTFLVIYIRWATKNQDIDLYVEDPSGAVFYYKKRTIPDRPGEFSEDSTVGPGNEVWEIREAPPGKYNVFVSLYDPRGNNNAPVIKGKVFYRDGTKALPSVTLTTPKEKKLMATIIVNSDGSVRF